MELSYWEYKTWLSNIDFTIVGSGIVGLTTALQLRKRFPKAKILIIEKGILPQGASTKNAGFACFGSASELLSDLKAHNKEEVLRLVQQRWKGIQELRGLIGDRTLNFEQNGGHELFLEKDKALFYTCCDKLPMLNKLLLSVFKEEAFNITENKFGFKGVNNSFITQKFEGQIDTGAMMEGLLRLAKKEGVAILNGVSVNDFRNDKEEVIVKTNQLEFKTQKLFITTNGFVSQLLNENVKPARAQVLVTKPIPNLEIKGTFHFDEGYYYFRNVDNRILFGGGRNLDYKAEETDEFGKTALVQNELIRLLNEVILPDTNFELDRSWSGIMGIGNKKKPIIKQVSDNVFCGVRLGGMGIAIGSLVGKELAALA
ncbi:FAD-dependent oxidoreductase [Croceitalea sp. MTPC9]|uniref:NAD(P)/FAD-dependent oxidoreductase n=1 Tax=unclassified Croceitalea TaxID=2632280 RepID=UPI002B39BCBF|nr:FAD-dependent oxidoreductase [Croceitalea sp. MTPC6]GMN16686.1 FAD-dependent oxidoreductase [Croceitalea sp. MTPC9]